MGWPIPTPDSEGRWVWFTKDTDGYLAELAADEVGAPVRCVCGVDRATGEQCGGGLKVMEERAEGAMTRCDRCGLESTLSDVRLWDQMTVDEQPTAAVDRLLRDIDEDE